MPHGSRRDFLADVVRGMLIASLGPALTAELGISRAWAATGSDGLTFGSLEPLVVLMQETPPERLLPLLVQKLAEGADLRTLVAAGALANARTFGGQDYTGYHSLMALAPAYDSAGPIVFVSITCPLGSVQRCPCRWKVWKSLSSA